MVTTSPEMVKARAKELLRGISGVGSIGLFWDDTRQLVLRVDIHPEADRHTVEDRLRNLGAKFALRTVSGRIQADS
jgi:hypothetical protein